MVSDRWCILRMAGASTMSVAQSLSDAGFEVWTPIETQRRRAPRSKALKDIVLPIMPGIVFANAVRLDDLIAMSRSPALTYKRWNSETKRMEMHGCPHFSVFRYDGRFPLIADRQLDALRQAEQRGRPRSLGPVVEVGDVVRHPAGILGGLKGVVTSTRRRTAMVMFGSLEIEIEMHELLPAKITA